MIIALMYLSSKYGRKTILIDLGLVALFGMFNSLIPRLYPPTSPLTPHRRLHRPLNQRHLLPPLLLLLPHLHLPNRLPLHHRAPPHRHPPNQIRQPRSTALRLHPSHTDAIRPLHHLRHPRLRNPLPGFRNRESRADDEVLRRVRTHVLGGVAD